MGELHYFLGVSVKQNAETPGTKLLKATEQSNMVDATLYQSVVGSLLYLSGWTRN